MRRTFFRTKNGFTIVELLIIMILIGVVFAILSLLMYLPIRNADFTQKQYTTFEEMRKIVEVMRKELTLAESATATNALPTSISTNQVVFYAGSDRGFYLKTITNEATISSLKIACQFEVNWIESDPPKPRQVVKVRLEHRNPDITFETNISLLNSMNLPDATPTSGNVLIVKK